MKYDSVLLLPFVTVSIHFPCKASMKFSLLTYNLMIGLHPCAVESSQSSHGSSAKGASVRMSANTRFEPWCPLIVDHASVRQVLIRLLRSAGTFLLYIALNRYKYYGINTSAHLPNSFTRAVQIVVHIMWMGQSAMWISLLLGLVKLRLCHVNHISKIIQMICFPFPFCFFSFWLCLL